jgi:hypothetical protein
MQTDGRFSYAKEYDIERKWRDVRLYRIAQVSTNLVLAYLDQHVLGMERSYWALALRRFTPGRFAKKYSSLNQESASALCPRPYHSVSAFEVAGARLPRP